MVIIQIRHGENHEYTYNIYIGIAICILNWYRWVPAIKLQYNLYWTYLNIFKGKNITVEGIVHNSRFVFYTRKNNSTLPDNRLCRNCIPRRSSWRCWESCINQYIVCISARRNRLNVCG